MLHLCLQTNYGFKHQPTLHIMSRWFFLKRWWGGWCFLARQKRNLFDLTKCRLLILMIVVDLGSRSSSATSSPPCNEPIKSHKAANHLPVRDGSKRAAWQECRHYYTGHNSMTMKIVPISRKKRKRKKKKTSGPLLPRYSQAFLPNWRTLPVRCITRTLQDRQTQWKSIEVLQEGYSEKEVNSQAGK